MIAIFTSLPTAQGYADDVQAYLVANRLHYNASLWAVPRKHPTLSKWAAPCPPEPVPCSGEIVDHLSEDWDAS